MCSRANKHQVHQLCVPLCVCVCVQVPVPDGGGWPVCGRRVQPVCVPAGRAGHGAEGRARRPARLPAAPRRGRYAVLLIAGPRILHTGNTRGL